MDRGKKKENVIWMLQDTFFKKDVLKFLDNIAGDSRKHLTIKQLRQWKDLIFIALRNMRSDYINDEVPEDYDIKVYYDECWEKIEKAKSDRGLLKAIEYLRESIRLE